MRGKLFVNIGKDKVVSFHYRLSEENGDLIEENDTDKPLVYLHGHNALLPALEEEMVGKAIGDKFSVTLTPEQAYGPVRENSVQRVTLKHIANSKKIKKFKPGMKIQVNTSEGLRDVVVVKAGLKTVDVDTNHPYAGKTLTFDVEVNDIRDADQDEITHGHAHGPGGHHH